MIKIKPLAELIGVSKDQLKYLVYKKYYYQMNKKFGAYYIEYELAKCIAMQLQHKTSKPIKQILAEIDNLSPQ